MAVDKVLGKNICWESGLISGTTLIVLKDANGYKMSVVVPYTTTYIKRLFMYPEKRIDVLLDKDKDLRIFVKKNGNEKKLVSILITVVDPLLGTVFKLDKLYTTADNEKIREEENE